MEKAFQEMRRRLVQTPGLPQHQAEVIAAAVREYVQTAMQYARVGTQTSDW